MSGVEFVRDIPLAARDLMRLRPETWTAREFADACGVSTAAVRDLARRKGWRLKTAPRSLVLNVAYRERRVSELKQKIAERAHAFPDPGPRYSKMPKPRRAARAARRAMRKARVLTLLDDDEQREDRVSRRAIDLARAAW